MKQITFKQINLKEVCFLSYVLSLDYFNED